MERFSFSSIGVFHSDKVEKYELFRQPIPAEGPVARIELDRGKNLDQALDGLQGFERIWVLFTFHQATGWKPKVMPSRYFRKLGLFATRSPHRPNPIGMSCLRLRKICGRVLYVEGADLVDGTPILDIKPYLPYCDSFSSAKAGWVDETSQYYYLLLWSQQALAQKEYLYAHKVIFADAVFESLRYFLGPNHYNRITHLGSDHYLLAYKSWRFIFHVHQEKREIDIKEIVSGYKIDQIHAIADDDQRLLHTSYIIDFPSVFCLHRIS